MGFTAEMKMSPAPASRMKPSKGMFGKAKARERKTQPSRVLMHEILRMIMQTIDAKRHQSQDYVILRNVYSVNKETNNCRLEEGNKKQSLCTSDSFKNVYLT
jgi:hypothetical protein